MLSAQLTHQGLDDGKALEMAEGGVCPGNWASALGWAKLGWIPRSLPAPPAGQFTAP